MTERLLLDEHFPPVLAELLRADGFDVIGISESVDFMGLPDDEVYTQAIMQGRRVVTENVRDFRPLLTRAIAVDEAYAPLLLTTAKQHSRPVSALGPLVEALHDWLARTDPPKQIEEWL